ncbi:hypothetical protein CK203_081231 [Vitis vinifera]|uniref:Endonuclease/exonuclease/phosphatase domain-containing protein n=1 Tax=Vitis vinifera TaxID=29760 RepID=A0A438DAK9_VITVI|nr:hypothetical protein CK203_081231 [Vitis vinifera]
MRESESLMVNARVKITDEALVAEASRYDSFPTVFGGDRDFFSSSLLLLPLGGKSLAEIRVREEVDEPEFDEARQKREVSGSSWDDSSLTKFSKSLGFTIEGVEGEILKLLLRLKKQKRPRVLELVGMEVGLFSISCRFKNCEDGFVWIFSGVYGPTMKRFREFFWEELGAIRGLWNDPWCIGGDFNMIRFPDERRRRGKVSSSMRRFSEENWEGHFSGVVQCTLPRLVSNHFPILLDGGREKLKALKAILKIWNKDVFGKAEVNKRLALDKVALWDAQEKLRSLSLEELEARKEAKGDYKKWALMEEIS